MVSREDKLLAQLERWLAERDGSLTIFEIIQEGDGELFAAYVLKSFRAAARDAVLDRLNREAAAFHPEPDELANAAMRVFTGLANAWALAPAEQAALLGLATTGNIEDLASRSARELPIAVIERLGTLLDIFEAINTLLPLPARADAWMRAPNTAPPFEGLRPLDFMTKGLPELRQVRQYLLAERWGI